MEAGSGGEPGRGLGDGDALWRLTVEHSPVGMAVLTPAGRLVMANRALCSMLGRTEEQMLAMSFSHFTHPDDVASSLASWERVARGEVTSYRITKRYVHADGSVVWGDLSVALMRGPDGRPLQVVSQVLDVTTQVESRERLVAATARIERERRVAMAVGDTAEVGLALVDPRGQYLWVSRQLREHLQLAYPDGHRGWAGQPGDLFAADGRTRLDPDDVPSSRALREGSFDDQLVWIGADPATRRALSVSARTVHEDDGTVLGVAMSYTDVTVLAHELESREQLIAVVSHELRTPLTVVLNHLELVLGGAVALDADTTHSLEVALHHGLRLRRLVADLLLSAQEGSRGLRLTRARTDLAALVREVVEVAGPAAQRVGVDLRGHAPPQLHRYVDALRLRQVLDNLVANALAYTPTGGRVDLVLRGQGDEGAEDGEDGEVVLEVRDTGIGITPEDQEHIFEQFFRAPAARSRSGSGLGLGLAVVESLVKAHEGRCEVTSTADGTTVLVRLPGAPTPAADGAAGCAAPPVV